MAIVLVLMKSHGIKIYKRVEKETEVNQKDALKLTILLEAYHL
jgi:hypothetical protein